MIETTEFSIAMTMVIKQCAAIWWQNSILMLDTRADIHLLTANSFQARISVHICSETLFLFTITKEKL